MTTYAQTARNTPSRHAERATYERAAAHELLDEAYLCHVGFVVDGEPRVLPTLFVRVGETVFVHGSTAASWPLAARRGDGLPVCFEVTALDALVLARAQLNHSANYRSLVAHGVARLVTDEADKRAAMDALMEKVGEGRAVDCRPPTAAEMARTAVLALPLEDVSMKRRAHGVVDDAEDLDLPYWAGIVPFITTRGYGVPDAGVTVPAPAYVPVPDVWHRPVTLRGEHVILEPTRIEDADELFEALGDDEVWRHMTVPRPTEPAAIREIIARSLARQARGETVQFTQKDARTGAAIGLTSFYDIRPDVESIAIGGTQVARPHWRTGVNTEAKLLLMTYAFETLGAGRVEWHTDIRNERSQAAIARLGAAREGVFRRHKRRGDGSWRDSVMFALTVEEWPEARDRLAARLAAGHTR